MVSRIPDRKEVPMPTTADYVNKIAGLFAKAGSTAFPEEAETAIALAQKLMAAHAIDEAMLEAAGRQARDEIVDAELIIPDPYQRAKGLLLHVVAKANRCRSIRIRDPYAKTVTYGLIGHSSDVENVQTLFVALLAHETRVMLSTEVPHWENTRAFRQSFLLGYAERIGERLEEASRQAVADAEEEHGTSVALVLVERDKLVEVDYRKKWSPRMGRISSSGGGSEQGARAANNADLGQRRLNGVRAAIGA